MQYFFNFTNFCVSFSFLSPTFLWVYFAIFHGVVKSQTRLSDWTELNWTELSVYISVLLSQFFPLSLPHSVHNSILSVCITIPALQISSSVPLFSVSYNVLIYVYLFFSDNVTLYDDSRFPHFHMYWHIVINNSFLL